jgi:hypothetical protein
MLDREDDLLLLPFRQALRERPKGQAPIDALRALIEGVREQKHPFARIHPRSVDWCSWRWSIACEAMKRPCPLIRSLPEREKARCPLA